METILFELNYLGESSQEQLDAYRNIGSVKQLRRMKRQEMRRRRRINGFKKNLTNAVFGAMWALDAWVILSWIDIVMHNLDANPVYQAWNFFTLCT